MILKASQRGGGMALAAHLLKDENEHVEVHDIKGFAADNLKGAMKEAQAVAKGTRCKQHLFSVSLNPPANENVPVAAFEDAIERVEKANGLSGHPRMVIFHTKEARRHCHVVWSRIDPQTMTARRMSHFKTKLREVSKSLYRKFGWQMPRGLMDGQERDPRNFTLAEWQQAKRMGRDPGRLKATVQDCWMVSKDRVAFAAALAARGLYIAKGDRRTAPVIVAYEGEVLSVARLTGKRAKEITAKLGNAHDLKSIAETKAYIAGTVAPRLRELIAIADREKAEALAPLDGRRLAMKERHINERQRLDEGQDRRRVAETITRAGRFRPGLSGMLDRVTGRHADTVRQNEAEAFAGFKRDRGQKDELVADQLKERRMLQREIVAVRHRHAGRMEELYRDLARQDAGQHQGRDPDRQRPGDAFNRAADTRSAEPALETRGVTRIVRARTSERGTGRNGPRGPDLGR